QLESLAQHKQKLTVLTGYGVHVPNVAPHWAGAAGLLTGHPILQEDSGDTFAAPSIDQVVANAIGGETLFRSLETGATNVGGSSFSGPNTRNPPEADPYALYERLFGSTFVEPGGEGIVDPRLGLRRSALDAVLEDLHALEQRVSSSDRIRLERHAAGIRTLEERLARLEEDPPNLAACYRPAGLTADFGDLNGRPQVEARNRAMSSLLAMAFACDQTRVFSHFLSDPVDNVLFPNASTGHHELTHDEPGEQPEVNALTKFCVSQFGVLLEELDAIEEGDGTLLDHCVIMGATEVSRGQTHSIDDMPILLAGGGDGAFRTGIHHRSVSLESTTKVLISVQRAVGMNVADFGAEDAYADSEVTEILP
ncbi:MAG: DUF1552 domain-containing protein, partial [Myxococcota bacterium]|nr:DUF1552 domain-containing protein [Myxococcota bacterium]